MFEKKPLGINEKIFVAFFYITIEIGKERTETNIL